MWTNGTDLAIAFHDVENQDLMLATRAGGGSFDLQTIATGEFVGADTEIFANGDEFAVLYFDGSENNMMVAREDGGAWVSETLGGDTTAVGFHNEVTELAGQTWVASYDYTNRNIYIRTLE